MKVCRTLLNLTEPILLAAASLQPSVLLGAPTYLGPVIFEAFVGSRAKITSGRTKGDFGLNSLNELVPPSMSFEPKDERSVFQPSWVLLCSQ